MATKKQPGEPKRPIPEHLKQYAFTKDQDREKARINGRKGYEKRMETLRQRRTVAEAMAILLELPLDPGKSESVEKATSLKEAKTLNPPAAELIALSQISRALKGDTKAAEFIIQAMEGTIARNLVSPLDSLAEQIAQYKEYESAPKKRGRPKKFQAAVTTEPTPPETATETEDT